MLLPSLLGFALCFVCLAATTWAWFTASVTSEANTIQTAHFDVEVYLDGSTTPVATDANGKYTLPTGTYSVTMSKTGDATGYFGFEVDGTPYRTTAITANTPITITIQNNRTSPIICSFTSYWGTPDGTTVGNGQAVTFNAVLPPEIISITDGETIIVGEPSEDPADETQQEEGAEDEKKDESSPDENNPADDTSTGGEGENTSTDTSTDGDGNEEQQPDGSSDPANGENGQQGGETPDVSEGNGDNNGETDNTGDDTITGGETPTDTTTPAGGDVPTEPVVTTDPTAQSEGGAPANPAPSE